MRLTALVLLFLHVTVTDSLFSSIHSVSEVGEGDKLLLLGDYLEAEDDRSRRGGVGQRGENCVSISQKGEGDITSAKGGRRLADCLISQVRGSVVSGTRTLGQ